MAPKVRLDRAAVVEAAAKMVEEEGLDQLSLGRLAERLGIRTPSLYNHVDGLSDLKRALALDGLRDLLATLTRATVGKSQAEAILAFTETYRAYAREAPGRYAISLHAPDPGDQELQALAGQLVDVLRAILAPYHLSREDSIHAIRGLRSLVHGFVSLEATGGFGLPVNRDASFRWLVRLFIRGLEKMNA